NPTVHRGKLKHFAPESPNDVYSLFRYDEKAIIMLVINPSDEDKVLEWNRFEEILGDEASRFKNLNDEGISTEANFTVPARSARIMQMDK
ncbi:MAG: alpha-amylase, partial [Flavobacteriales bacterium]|nr:alpha-amylase [Flavobacteriales bacterium]